MSWFANKPKNELLQQLAQDGAAIREMMQHRAGAIVTQRLEDELLWVKTEWRQLLERNDVDIYDKQRELYSYLRALQLVEHIFLGLPKSGWRAEDKLLHFANRR